MYGRAARKLGLFFAVSGILCAAQQSQPRARAAYGELPLTFEANQGQAAPQAKFLVHGKGYTGLLTSGGLTLALRSSVQSRPVPHARSTRAAQTSVVHLSLQGTAANSTLIGEDQQPGRVNYFLGNNPRQWRTNIPTFSRVRSQSVYPGIDLVYYGTRQQLEYDFEIAPGADPNQIRFEITGAHRVAIDGAGNLVVNTAVAGLNFHAPAVYQRSATGRVPVPGNYVLVDSTHVGFHVTNYDRSAPLVIDPVLTYSTYLGGSGNDDIRGLAVDASGNIYVAGFTDSADFPLTTLGSLAPGSPHVFVAKLNSTASQLIYVDFIGGNDQDYGYALALDSSNRPYVTGSTASSNFPVVNAYQSTYPGSFNAFVTKIAADGASLVYSTYLGGNGSDTPASIAVDPIGNAVVAGSTTSTTFPVSNAFQSTASPNGGGQYGQYGFITKLAPAGSTLVFSTYLAGSSNVPYNCGGTPCWSQPFNSVSSIALDGSGNIFAAGATNTYDFPSTSGAYLTTNSTQLNATVGFLSKLSGAGAMQDSTYFYESSGLLTQINAIAVDSSSSAYVTGTALSDGTFPVTSTSICDPGTDGFNCSFAFVSKFDSTLATLSYSTFLGPNNYATPAAIALDTGNNAYVAAVTSNSAFATLNPIEGYGAASDTLLVEIDPTASSQVWSTYLGAAQDDGPTALVLDSAGNLYLAGTTTSTDFPASSGALQTISAGNTDSFIARISPASAPAVIPAPLSVAFAAEAVGSTSDAQSVLLRNMGSADLSISSINATGDFSQSSDCRSTVAAAGTCTVSVTFTPTVAGHRTGSLQISSNAAGSPHSVSLAGDGQGPAVTLAPTSLTFSSTTVGSSTSSQPATLTNSGNASLTISSIQASGDFSQTNNCGSSLAASSSCTINVIFTPTASGSRTGSLQVTDNAAASPQSVSLSGTGSSSDFMLSATSASATVASGSSATYPLTITPVGGAFTNAVALSCSGLPAHSSCTFAPGSVTPAGSPASSTLTITTTSNSAALQRHSSIFYALWLQFPFFSLIVLALVAPKKARARARTLAMLTVVACLMFLSACAGGTGITSNPKNGTPTGTYTITVTGTSGSLQHQLPLTLIVQ